MSDEKNTGTPPSNEDWFSEDEEDIIELTEVVSEGDEDDEDVIDLTETAADAADDEKDEATIDLEDIIDGDMDEALDLDGADEALELDTPSVAFEENQPEGFLEKSGEDMRLEEDPVESIPSESPGNVWDETAESADTVETMNEKDAAGPMEAPAHALDLDDGDFFEDTTGEAADDKSSDDFLEYTRKLDTGEAFDSTQADEELESLGLEFEEAFDTEEPTATAPSLDDTTRGASQSEAALTVTEEQLDASVERVLLRLFSEKIERLMTDAVEKAITKEIENLRDIILKEMPDTSR